MIDSLTTFKIRIRITMLALALCVALTPPVQAQEFWEHTFLLDLRTGSSRSDIAKSLARGGYELDDGTPIDFDDWYKPRFPDLNMKFMTSLSTDFGIIWGFSTGERGEKYRIDPGLWIGLIYRHETSSQSDWNFSIMSMLGGDFSERDCVGDWPEFGGLQRVNCRLAATPLPPMDTLKFLIRESGFRETRATLRYQIRF